MNFLKKMFNKKEELMESWKIINNESQLDEIKEFSEKKPIIIFKHSTRCGISAHAKHKLESAWNFKDSDLDFYYLDLITYRNISNKIAEMFDVFHQSPQIIIVKNKKAVSNFSHQSISIEKIRKNL